MRLIKSNIREKKKMSSDDNPCWDEYEMIGTKMKDGKEVPNCVPERKENVKLYLSKDLLDYDKPLYPKSKKIYKEIDMEKVKKTLVAGAIAGTSLFPSSTDASSNYFNIVSNTTNKSNLKNLPVEEQIKVYQNALDHLQKGDSDRYRIQKIIDDLKKKLRKENYLKITNRRKKQLDEMNWKDVTNLGKKAITGTLLISASFMPIAQDLYGDDSCSIDSSGEVVSCDVSKLQSKKSVKDVLSTIKLGIKTINDNLNDPKYLYHADFTEDEIQAVRNRLNELDNRKNITPNNNEKIDISNAKIEIENLEKKLKKVLSSKKKKKEMYQIQQTKFQKYLIEKLTITLSEAILIEKEIKNYTKIKKTFLKENENFINYKNRYADELNSAELYFNRFFNKYDSTLNEGNKQAIEKMKEVFNNNNTEYFKYAYPFADLYNLLHTVNNVKRWGIGEYPEIANEIKELHSQFMMNFAKIISEDSNPNYFFLGDNKYYSKKDFFLKIEDMSSKVLGKTLSQKFEEVFLKNLKEVFENKLDKELM